MKTHLKKVIGETLLNFEELTTILTQVEACLNSQPLTPIPSEEDGIEVLTPGHFLIGQPLEAIPDSKGSYGSISILRHWHLCQNLIRHFWTRWSKEYLVLLRRYNKWQSHTRNFCIGDIVLVQDETLIPCKPLGRIIEVHKGKDDLVRVVTVRMKSGVYKRPITKVALLFSESEKDK